MKDFGYELDDDLGVPFRNDLTEVVLCCDIDSS